MKKLFLKILFVLFLSFLFVSINPGKTNAQTCSAGSWTTIYFCSTNGTGTTWGVLYDYYFSDGRAFSAKTVWVSINGSGYQCPSGTDQYQYVGIPSLSQNYKPQSGDQIYWHTACTDPTVDFVPTVNNYCKMGEGVFYTDSIDISCYNVNSKKYAGCYHLQGVTSLGSVAASAQCPYQDTTDSYCTKNGNIAAWPEPLCGHSYCGGTGSCTYYNKTCSGTSCSHPGTTYSTSCGGAAISGTYMCSSYSYSCSPPAPAVTLTTSCSGAIPQIKVNRTNNVQHYNGNYDLRWRKSGGAFTNVCSPTNPYTITGLAQSTSYEVQVRGGTTAGYNGPTNFSSDTITTPSCAVNGVCAATHYLCTAGTSTNNVNGATAYTWTCNGLNGGTNASCQEAKPPYNVKAHVYVDFNGDGLQNSIGDPGYTGTINEPDYAPTAYTPLNDITYGGATGANTTVTTGALGIYEVTNIPPGTNNETLAVNPPTGWTVTTANNVQVSGPLALEQTVNFGIHPTAPTCTMKTNQATRYTLPPNNTATLTVNAVKPPTYAGTITYRWFTDLGSVSPATTTDPTNTATWTAPSPYWDSGTQAKPSAQACITGGSTEVCGSCGLGINPSQPPITIVPLHSISGLIYVDSNKNAQYNNPPELPYTGSSLKIRICPNFAGGSAQFCAAGNEILTNSSNGTFTTGATPNIIPGAYTVSLIPPLPDATYSYSGNSSYVITVGKPCAGQPTGINCDAATGNITNVNFGINNSNVWIQTTGGDIYQLGISNIEPQTVPAACGGSHMSVSNPAANIMMPGLVFTGNGSASFGLGDASLNNWVVGKGATYPNTITLPGATSYAAVTKSVKDAGATITPLPCASGDYATGCTLSNTLASGVYSVAGNLKLTGVGNTYTFPNNSKFTILIAGNLDIETEIHVPAGSGSFALFTASGDITVGGSIGSAFNATTPNIEGYYSTDQNFIAQGTNNCPTKDLRLNVAGAIITDANNDNSGSFQVKRDMCENDVCPTFSVQARPDLVLNAPYYLLSPVRIWQEVSP